MGNIFKKEENSSRPLSAAPTPSSSQQGSSPSIPVPKWPSDRQAKEFQTLIRQVLVEFPRAMTRWETEALFAMPNAYSVALSIKVWISSSTKLMRMVHAFGFCWQRRWNLGSSSCLCNGFTSSFKPISRPFGGHSCGFSAYSPSGEQWSQWENSSSLFQKLLSPTQDQLCSLYTIGTFSSLRIDV